MNTTNILIIIPARGGSKGIPRKNLRALAGKPLLYYSINCALASRYKPAVFVTSEDEEIITMARNFGAQVLKRENHLSNDDTTLDPVIYNAYMQVKEKTGSAYDLIITLQPTSPLLKTATLDSAIAQMLSDFSVDTLISATNDTHLTWLKLNDGFIPNYKERVNRQYLPQVFKETGGFLITRGNVITANSRIGKKTQLVELKAGENIDIDSYEDWNLCEYLIKRKKIVFVVAGNREIGLGHAANTLSLANEILNHEISFICLKGSELAFDLINKNNYPVFFQKKENIIEDILEQSPDIVINDCLDTDKNYISKLKQKNISVINFEDLGSGVEMADMVINALYVKEKSPPNQYFGFSFFCIKDEFIHLPHYTLSKEVKNILISFGGVDPCNHTCRVLNSIYQYCLDHTISITVVAGFGYNKLDTLNEFKQITLITDVKAISQYMLLADIAFTSGGRTTLELASIGVPTIVLCQNERETTHLFATNENGFINLGLGEKISSKELLHTFTDLINDFGKRKEMHSKLLSFDLKSGKKRVITLINSFINTFS